MDKSNKCPRQLVFAFILALLFLAGCVRIDTYEQFYPNGRSRVVTQIYPSNIAATLENAGLNPPKNLSWREYLKHQCLSLSERKPGSSCHPSGDWLIIDESRISGKGYAFSSYEAFPYTLYELRVFTPPNPPLEGLEEVGEFSIPKNASFSTINQSELAQIRSSGIKYNYLITVPGEVLEHNTGYIEEGGLVVDVMHFASRSEPIIIKSRELNLEQIATLAVAAILLFLFIDFVLIWALKEWAKRSDLAEQRRKRMRVKEARGRVFRKDSRLSNNQVYIAPGDESKKIKK